MAMVHVLSTDRELPAEIGRSLLDVLLDNREPISTSCGGIAACGQCRLRVTGGGEALAPVNHKETMQLGNLLVQQGWRLACQSRLVADARIEIDVPPPIDTAERKQAKWTRMQRERQSERQREQQVRRPSSGTSQGRPSSGTSQGRPSSGTSKGRGQR